MGNILCVPKGKKGRESTKGTKDRKREAKSTSRTRRSRRSIEEASRSLGVGTEEPLGQRNENHVPTRDCSSEGCWSLTLATDFAQAQPTSTTPCTKVRPVSAGDDEVNVLPNATQGGPEHSSVEVEASTDSVTTTKNVKNGQDPHACKDLYSNPEALKVDSTKVDNDIDVSEKHTKIIGSTSISAILVDHQTAINEPLIHKKQHSTEKDEDPSADIKGNDSMVPNEGFVSLQNGTACSSGDKIELETNIEDCEDDDYINPSGYCNDVDITFTEELYHGDGDMDKKIKDNLDGKDSVTCDIKPCVDSDTQTKTSGSGTQSARSNKSSHNSDVPGKGLSDSDRSKSDSQKRNSFLKEQLIEAVRRNQQLNVLHNRDKRVELIPRAKSFYRENNAPALRCQHGKLCDSKLIGEPVKKVSDFEVPKLHPCPPDMPTPLNTKTHVNTIPDVARSEAQNKITWRQTENQSSSWGQAWVSRTPVFQPPVQPLGERALDLFGSVDRMKRSWVIPECRQIETLKLEHCIYPGLYVYPHMRWQFTMDTTNRQDNKSKRRRYSDKQRTNGVVTRRKLPEQQSKTRPKSKNGGLTRWSRYDNINNLHKDRH